MVDVTSAVNGLVPDAGTLWSDLWPAVVIFLAVIILDGYVSAWGNVTDNTWNGYTPVRRLALGLIEAAQSLYLWATPPYGYATLIVPFRWVALVVGQVVNLGGFGEQGARLRSRIRTAFKQRSGPAQVALLVVGTSAGALVFLGSKTTALVALLTNFSAVAWGSLAAVAVGVVGYVEPLVTALPGISSFVGPEVALYAFIAVFMLVWGVDRFLWWRALNQRPILRFINRVFR